MLSARNTFLLGSTLFVAASCGDDGGPDAQTTCAKLTGALCERTTNCAISTGVTTDTHDLFNKRCLAALAQDLTCTEPTGSAADVEDCNVAIQNLPCDQVAAALNAGEVIAPTSSCGEFFGTP
jgi:hypothetical protein